MEIVFVLAGIIFILFIIISVLSIEKELRKLNNTSDKMVELLKDIKNNRPLN